jgi:hypothetical protein
MLWAEPGSLDSIVRVEKNEIGTVHRFDEFIGPPPTQRQCFGNLSAMEECALQKSAPFQRDYTAQTLTSVVHNLGQRIEYLRREVTKFIRASQIVEIFFVMRSPALIAGQVPANCEPTALHEVSKERELSKVADVADVRMSAELVHFI